MKGKGFLLNSGIAVGLVGLVYYLFFQHPVLFTYLVAEDYLGETATFCFWFFSSACLFLTLAQDHTFRKPGHYLLAIGALFMAMEEISWGQRIIDIPVLEFFQQYNAQHETNFHNIVPDAWYLPFMGRIIFLGAIVFPIAARLFHPIKRACEWFGILLVPPSFFPFYLIPVFFIDVSRAIASREELMELSLSLAFFLTTLDLNGWWKRKTQGPTGLWLWPGAIMTVLLATGIMLYAVPSAGNFKWHLQDLVTNFYPRKGMYVQASQILEFLDRYPEYRYHGLREPGAEAYFRGFVFFQLGDKMKARSYLERGLETLSQAHGNEALGPRFYRRRGQLLQLLDRIPEAEEAFRQASDLDLDRLSEITTDEEEAQCRWSLAKTLVIMGHQDTAWEQIRIARQHTKNPKLSRDMHLWRNRAQSLTTSPLLHAIPTLAMSIPLIPDRRPQSSRSLVR